MVLACALTGCGNSAGPNDSIGGSGGNSGAFSRGELAYDGAEPVSSCRSEQNLGGGRFYRVQIPSRVDGEAIVFTLFEPDTIDCGRKHPLVLEGHGFGGSKQTAKPAGSDIARLTGAGYAVISIDQRGHGESGGTVRVMDPDFEGQDLITIVDWAEQHLDYLAYRDDNLLLGSIGGSYGGGYQLLLYAVDPDQRLDAITPLITWHDLAYTLNPGNTVKSFWGLGLSAVGDTGGDMLNMDPFIRATVLDASITNHFPVTALDFLNYHSLSYFCANPRGIALQQSGDTSGYLLDPVTGQLPITADGHYMVKTPPLARMPKVDALIFQSTRDDLFNFNEAYANYQCLSRGGGDVRLLTVEGGHQLFHPSLGLVEQVIETQTIPATQTSCGSINAVDATLAWLNDKLRGSDNANSVITSGRDVCYSLTVGDAVRVPEVTVGGPEFPVELPGGLPVIVPIGSPAPMIVPLITAGVGGEVIAGIPTATISITRGDPLLDGMCQGSTDPIVHLGTCDATVFVGLGVIKAGGPIPLELIEEQVMPVRGIGQHEIELVGVAERIAPGDQIVLLFYGFQSSFAATTSRDLLTPLVIVSGTVRVPLLGNLPNITDLTASDGGGG